MARTIRDDFDGVVTVHVAGVPQSLRAGDRVPEGTKVPDSVLADGSAEGPSYTEPTPLSDSDRAKAVELGVPEDEVDTESPDFVRGYLAGYSAGGNDVAQAGFSALDPDDLAQTEGQGGVTVHGEPTPGGPSVPPTGEVTTTTEYDPASGDVDAVLAELEKASPADRKVILQRERDGKGRVGILQSKYADEA